MRPPCDDGVVRLVIARIGPDKLIPRNPRLKERACPLKGRRPRPSTAWPASAAGGARASDRCEMRRAQRPRADWVFRRRARKPGASLAASSVSIRSICSGVRCSAPVIPRRPNTCRDCVQKCNQIILTTLNPSEGTGETFVRLMSTAIGWTPSLQIICRNSLARS